MVDLSLLAPQFVPTKLSVGRKIHHVIDLDTLFDFCSTICLALASGRHRRGVHVPCSCEVKFVCNGDPESALIFGLVFSSFWWTIKKICSGVLVLGSMSSLVKERRAASYLGQSG